MNMRLVKKMLMRQKTTQLAHHLKNNLQINNCGYETINKQSKL